MTDEQLADLKWNYEQGGKGQPEDMEMIPGLIARLEAAEALLALLLPRPTNPSKNLKNLLDQYLKAKGE